MSKKEYKLKIKTEKNTLTNTYGKFILQPLERGYGVTVGNALRRVLLTCLPGAAITNVKVEGVLHEFSTISGVKEDMADICLLYTSPSPRDLSTSRMPSSA